MVPAYVRARSAAVLSELIIDPLLESRRTRLTRSTAAARQGRPAAAGRVLVRIVRDADQDTDPSREPNPLESGSPFLVRLS